MAEAVAQADVVAHALLRRFPVRGSLPFPAPLAPLTPRRHRDGTGTAPLPSKRLLAMLAALLRCFPLRLCLAGFARLFLGIS